MGFIKEIKGRTISWAVAEAYLLLLEKKIQQTNLVLYHSQKVQEYMDTGTPFERKKFLALIPR